MPISGMALNGLLKLPRDHVITAIHYDPYRDQILLRVAGPLMPLAPVEGRPFERVNAQYSLRDAEPGEKIAAFVSFEP